MSTGPRSLRVISGKEAAIHAYKYSNGEKKSNLSLKWHTAWDKPRSIKQMQSDGMRKVPISLAPVPRSKILTDDELK